MPPKHRTTIVWHIATTAEGHYGGFPPPPMHTVTAIGGLMLVDEAEHSNPPKAPMRVGFSLGAVGQPLRDGLPPVTEAYLLDKLLAWFFGADVIVGCYSDTFGLPVVYNRSFTLGAPFPWFDTNHGDPGNDVDVAQRFEIRGLLEGTGGFTAISNRLGLPEYQRHPAQDGRELPRDCLVIALAYLRTELVEGRLNADEHDRWIGLLRDYYTARDPAFAAFF